MVSALLDPARRRERSLCVSVVSHGHGEHVDQLLADLAALPTGTVKRVVVTVNCPDEEWRPRTVITGAEIEVLRNNAPQGFAANHNLAFAHCEEGFFAVVNPDIRFGSDPFAALLARLDADAACALAVPVQLDAEGRLESFARAVPTPLSVAARRLLPNGRRGVSKRPQWVSGAFMLWRAEAFARLGGFDAGYFLYCEDVDICLRLQLAGQRFAIVDSARVVHDAQRDSFGSPLHLLLHVRSLLRLWTSPVFWRFVRAEPRLAAAPT